MSFALDIDRSVIDDVIHGLPDPVIDGIEANLLRLASDPVNLSRKSRLPAPASGQCFDFACDHAGWTHYFRAFFFYTQDETTIYVYGLTHAVM